MKEKKGREITVEMWSLLLTSSPELKSFTYLMMSALYSLYPTNVIKLLIESSATFNLIFATHLPSKLPSTCVISRYLLINYKNTYFIKFFALAVYHLLLIT